MSQRAGYNLLDYRRNDILKEQNNSVMTYWKKVTWLPLNY